MRISSAFSWWFSSGQKWDKVGNDSSVHRDRLRRQTTEITYACACTRRGRGPSITASVAGKLAWKVSWPMRWAYEHVTFEPAGVDHSSPGPRRRQGAGDGHLRRRDAAALRVLLRGRPGSATRSSGSRGGARRRRTRWKSSRPRCCAGYTRGGGPSSPSPWPFNTEVGRTYDEWGTGR